MITWNGSFFHSPASLLMELVVVIHDYVMLLLFSVLISVLFVLFIPLINSFYNSEFFEHHEIEAVWTVAPFFMLTFILFPSLYSLYIIDSCFFCGLTLNIMGHQWYWSYFYNDISIHSFDSYIVPSSESNIRLLEVDNRVLVPSSVPLRFLVSSADVIHSWTVPSFGLNIDALPGRINQFCFSTNRSGVFFGQCSEICGANHSFIPIVVEAVPMSFFLDSGL